MRLNLWYLRTLFILCGIILKVYNTNAQAGSNSPVCAGSTILLTIGNTGTSYSWTGPDGFSSNTRNPSIPGATVAKSGTYSVTVTSASGSQTYTTDVQVKNTPNNPIVSSPQSACAGSPFVLFASNYDADNDYFWSKGTFSSNLDSLYFASANSSMQGTYSVYAVLAGCSSATATFTLNVNNPPITPVITTPNSVCEGTTLTLSTSNGVGMNYQWNGPLNYNSNQAISTINNVSVPQSGEYSVYYVDPNSGCKSATTKKTITVINAPAKPTISGDTIVCEQDTLKLFGSSTVTNPSFIWSGPAGAGNAKDYVHSPLVMGDQGVYTLVINDGACNSLADSVLVTVYPKPAKPTLYSNTNIYCEGDTIDLWADFIPGNGYQWEGPTGFSANTDAIQRQNIVMADSGIYQVQTLLDGCYSDADTIFIYIKPTPVVPPIIHNGPVCDQTNIDIIAATYTSPYLYQWEAPNGGTYSDSVIIPICNPGDAGYYKLRLSNNGCTSKPDSVYIKVKLLIKPTFSPYMPDTVCSGYELSFSAGNFESPSYVWKKDNAALGFSSEYPLGFVTEADTGLYSVTVTNTCDTASMSVQLVVTPSPDVEIKGDSLRCYYETKVLEATPGFTKYQWLTSPFDTTPIIEVDTTGIFVLEVTNLEGCTTKVAHKISLFCQPEVYIPNSFTPDNDGKNDLFGVITYNVQEFHIDIFNRIGRKVFESDDPFAMWDGTFNNHKLEGGQYVYVFKYKTMTNRGIYEDSKSGSFFMIR